MKPGRVPRESSVAEKAPPIKVGPERLESMIELIGELVVIRSQLSHNPVIAGSADPELQSLIGLLDRTLRELQERALALRMTSLKPLFMKVQRAARDLSVRLGKTVDFSTDGEDVEIDRGLIEAVTDPLLHLVRNAVDHGLESDEERLASSKTIPSRITLTARQAGGRVLIELRDYGRGIDREKVVRKAVERGLLAESTQSHSLADRDVHDLLFRPGFSTTDSVTDVSGRGVGLDVVRNQVEKLKGHVDVESTFGAGTLFRLVLPLTTAITDGLLVKTGGIRYVVSIGSVREILGMDQMEITTVDRGSRVIGLRGKFLPLYDLRSMLKQPTDASGSSKGAAVIAESSVGLVAVLVDEVVGQIQVVVKGLGNAVSRSEGLAGGAILGDGSVALVLDLDGLVKEQRSAA